MTHQALKIGFDAKRAFFNRSGLGNYSRSTISMLGKYFPHNKYFLYTPSIENAHSFPLGPESKIIVPTGVFNYFKTYWRSYRLKNHIKSDKLDIYHGLTNELPQDAHKTKAKVVTTIHDLIFFRYPDLYRTHDREYYFDKFKYSARIADKVIAISEQTKTDIIHFLEIPESDIEVIYQGCHPLFYKEPETELKIAVASKYNLPEQYILNVGTVEKRKNILSTVKAIHLHNIDIPLIIVGARTPYQSEIEEYVEKNNLKNRVFIYNHVPLEDLHVLYRLAELFVFPSLFEGFGIPILEALNSKIPVVTTKGGCFNEAGGFNSLYINPTEPESIAEAINKILSDSKLKLTMTEEGFRHAQKFNESKIAENLMNLYTSTEKK